MRRTSERFDVAVLGLGTMGSAAAHELAKRGVSVLGLERFSIPHALGSHHGDSRMIRLAYYEHPSYVPLLRRAYELWDELQREAATPLFHRTGGVFAGLPDETAGELVPGIIRAAKEHDLPHMRLSEGDLRSRYPLFNFPRGYEGVLEPVAGFLRPEAAIEAFAGLAVTHGAVLKSNEPVKRWNADDSRIVIETARATYEASHLVICGGAWASQLLGDLGVELRVTRQVLGWFDPKSPEAFAMDRFPVWGMDDPHVKGALLYGFPIVRGGRPGVKLARHFPAKPTTPDAVDREPSNDDRIEIERIIDQVLPDQAGPVTSLGICLYTNTPDAHFIIDSHPSHSNVTFAAGFSGHGFKFASVFGEVLADLALDGGTRHPIDILRLKRFHTGTTLR